MFKSYTLFAKLHCKFRLVLEAFWLILLSLKTGFLFIVIWNFSLFISRFHCAAPRLFKIRGRRVGRLKDGLRRWRTRSTRCRLWLRLLLLLSSWIRISTLGLAAVEDGRATLGASGGEGVLLGGSIGLVIDVAVLTAPGLIVLLAHVVFIIDWLISQF